MTGRSNRSRLALRLLVSALLALVVAVALTAAMLAPLEPRADRLWAPDHAVMPATHFEGHLAHVDQVRNFRHPAAGRFVAAYDERTYDLDRLESVWFVLVPFGTTWRGPAHSFVSFGFRSDSAHPQEYVAISVEARREPGEHYSALLGLLKRFELLYVVGDERDLIAQRAVGGDDVYLYPIHTTPDKMRRMFVEMLQRANALREHPEFYNTLTNNCTSNLVDHVNAITRRKVPQGLKTILPGYSDEVAYAIGLIDTPLSLEEARRRFYVTKIARAAADSPDFSQRIRGLK
jgi:hypothetical protein